MCTSAQLAAEAAQLGSLGVERNSRKSDAMAGSSAAAAVDLTDGEPAVPPVNAAPVDLTGDDTDVD